MTLTAQEELALRRLGNQSIGIAPDAARLLVRLAFAEPYRDGWRLTPLGLQCYQALPKTSTAERKPFACDRQHPQPCDSPGSLW